VNGSAVEGLDVKDTVMEFGERWSGRKGKRRCCNCKCEGHGCHFPVLVEEWTWFHIVYS